MKKEYITPIAEVDSFVSEELMLPSSVNGESYDGTITFDDGERGDEDDFS